jgi:hypothetical protein
MSRVSAKRSARVPLRESAARLAAGTGRDTLAEPFAKVGEVSAEPSPCEAEVVPHGAALEVGPERLTGVGGLRRLNGQGRFSGYVMRGRWLTDDRYGELRNAAWMLRNSRVGLVNNPAALRLVIQASERLIGAGDPLADVLEAFAELLIHP